MIKAIHYIIFLIAISLAQTSFANIAEPLLDLFSTPKTFQAISSSTLLGMQCTSCSSSNIKIFSIALSMSPNENCSNAQSLTFTNAALDTSATFYLDGLGLSSYASRLPTPINHILCTQLSVTGGGAATKTALVSGPPYIRTFPANSVPVLALS